jgi:glutamate formiminotransferase/formiminotetrahydrofolate cyclodeaminase
MAQIVECVPNFSEGRDLEAIEKIAQACRSTLGCSLLDYDPGASTNRTVFTFVGSPAAVVEGALNMARVASEVIDMTTHTGEHPRMGAMDVCPFVPVSNVSMEECVQCANEFGRRAAAELDIPIFLYEHAAKQDYRRLLPQVRQGEYEGLESRLSEEKWRPDFGPARFVPKWGATATGARKFLIAYNVNLLGTKQQAHRIALNIRENGRGPGQEGRLSGVKGIGWYVDEYDMAQIRYCQDVCYCNSVMKLTSNGRTIPVAKCEYRRPPPHGYAHCLRRGQQRRTRAEPRRGGQRGGRVAAAGFRSGCRRFLL